MAFAALVALPLQAQAQTVITLVSNTGQASSGSPARSDRAQGFTTGSNADGYTLSSIDIVSDDPQGTSFTATLYTSNTSGHPGTAVATLTAPISFAAGTLTFTAPANTTLSANRDYFVLVSVSGAAALDLSYTSSDAEDAGAATGWSIANDYLWNNSGTWQTTTSRQAFLIGVKGYANTGTANIAPTTTGGRVTTPAGTAYTFSAADFNFSDSDPGDTLASVIITSVPDVVAGTVNVNGTPVVFTDLPKTVTKADIDAGHLTFTPPANTGSASFTFRVNDGEADSTTGIMTITVVAATNAAPTVANMIPDQRTGVETAYRYEVPANTFNDTDNDPLTYSATQADNSALPTWLTFTAATRVFSGTPQAADAGMVSVKVTANDGAGGSVSDTFVITVDTGHEPGRFIVSFGTATGPPVKVREGVGHWFPLTLRTNRYAPPDANPQQPVQIPLVVTHTGTATEADYENVPTTVTFGVGESQTGFSLRAIPDQTRETGEGLRLDFGTLPPGITKSDWGPYETIEFVDEHLPEMTASFGAEEYTATEGGAAAQVSIHLNTPVEIEPAEVELLLEYGGGATAADHGSIQTVVRFPVGTQTQTITVAATDDMDDDDGESVSLRFVDDPNRRVTPFEDIPARVALKDNDGAQTVTVSFGAPTYTASEYGADATVLVQLDTAPGRQVTVPLTTTNAGGATAADHSGIPGSVTFGASQTTTTFTVTATADSNNRDGGESVSIGFGTLPVGVLAGSPASTTVALADGSEQSFFVSFSTNSSHAVQVREGGVDA